MINIFGYKNRVKIMDAFYKECEGIVLDCKSSGYPHPDADRPYYHYLVKFDGIERWFGESYLIPSENPHE